MANRKWNKLEVVEVVASEADLSKAAAERALDAILGTITGALQRGEAVQLTGFGTFEARERKARTGRNPQTGEELFIPARKVPAFRAGKQLKDAVT